MCTKNNKLQISSIILTSFRPPRKEPLESSPIVNDFIKSTNDLQDSYIVTTIYSKNKAFHYVIFHYVIQMRISQKNEFTNKKI